jgi:hypothetical protein
MTRWKTPTDRPSWDVFAECGYCGGTGLRILEPLRLCRWCRGTGLERREG